MATPATADYLMIDGVAHPIRDLNAVPQTRLINGKMLNQDLQLTLFDLGETITTNEEIDQIIDS